MIIKNWTYVKTTLNPGPIHKLAVFREQSFSKKFYDEVNTFLSEHSRWMQRVVTDINAVRASGLANRYGLRIPVNTSWNTELLRSLLFSYKDIQIVEWLHFGWPLGFHPFAPPPDWAQDNHDSANKYSEQVDNYILKELKQFALLGPFQSPPFEEPVGCCAISTRSKRESTDRWILMDYSWPLQRSINDYISKDFYLGQHIQLSYPKIDDLCQRVAELGPTCLMFKKDIKRAFKRFILILGTYHCRDFV